MYVHLTVIPVFINAVTNPRHRVLVVDDYPDSAEVVRTLIELLGHEARVAGSGRAALAEAYGFDPTIVILDLGLPDINGCDVARELRSRRGGERLHIAALSGWGQPEKRRAALSAGCDQFVVKPANGTKIRSILQAVPVELSPPH
jgi:DNA-binding response OmpR family regulator